MQTRSSASPPLRWSNGYGDLFAFCAIKSIGGSLAPVIADELRGSGGETPDGITALDLMRIYNKLASKPGISCGVIPAAGVERIAAEPYEIPVEVLPSRLVNVLNDPSLDILVVGDSSLALSTNGRYHNGSFTSELNSYMNR